MLRRLSGCIAPFDTGPLLCFDRAIDFYLAESIGAVTGSRQVI